MRAKIKKNGFTMVELIGAIAILGVLVLLVIPSVSNSIKKSKEKALERTIGNIEDSAYNYSVENNIAYNGFINLNELQEKGFLKQSDIINPVTNEKMTGCVKYSWSESAKQYEFEYTTECTMPTYYEGQLLKIEVGSGKIGYFYVLQDNGSTITLIMDRNLGDNVAWASLEDMNNYASKNNVNINSLSTTQKLEFMKSMGAITANKQIENLRWNNVNEVRLPSAVDLISKTKWYKSLTTEEKLNWENLYITQRKNLAPSGLACSTNSNCRAAIAQLEKNIGTSNNSVLLPTWLDINLYTSGDDTVDSNRFNKYGYWTSEPISVEPGDAWCVISDGWSMDDYNVGNYSDFGVRPVITINKSYVLDELYTPIYVNDSN